MAQQSFSHSVDAWVAKSKQRLDAVFKTSAQYVFEDVIDRTRVDTGYLVNSFTVTLNTPLPMRADAKAPEGTAKNAYQPQPFALEIANADLTDTIYGTFVANYAGVREHYDGMVRLSAQNWPQHVNRAVAEAKARVRG